MNKAIEELDDSSESFTLSSENDEDIDRARY